MTSRSRSRPKHTFELPHLQGLRAGSLILQLNDFIIMCQRVVTGELIKARLLFWYKFVCRGAALKSKTITMIHSSHRAATASYPKATSEVSQHSNIIPMIAVSQVPNSDISGAVILVHTSEHCGYALLYAPRWEGIYNKELI